MEVVLKEDVANLGEMGNVVRVRDGYARNYLLPQGLVVIANTKNLKALEHERRMIGQHKEQLIKQAQGMSDQLAGVTLDFAVKVGEEGKLFGSVTNQDIERALNAQGFAVDRRKILLDEPIKLVGEYEVSVRLGPEVTPSIKVRVASETEAATASQEVRSG